MIVKEACRLCLKPIDYSRCTVIKDEEKYSKSIVLQLNVCLPEIDINLIKKSLMCNRCTSTLNGFNSFKNVCLANEKLIRNHMKKMENVQQTQTKLIEKQNIIILCPENKIHVSPRPPIVYKPRLRVKSIVTELHPQESVIKSLTTFDSENNSTATPILSNAASTHEQDRIIAESNVSHEVTVEDRNVSCEFEETDDITMVSVNPEFITTHIKEEFETKDEQEDVEMKEVEENTPEPCPGNEFQNEPICSFASKNTDQQNQSDQNEAILLPELFEDSDLTVSSNKKDDKIYIKKEIEIKEEKLDIDENEEVPYIDIETLIDIIEDEHNYHAEPPEPVIFTDCSVHLTRDKLLSQEDLEQTEFYVCSSCESIFLTKSALATHLKFNRWRCTIDLIDKMMDEQRRPYKCVHCDYVTTKRCHYKQHVKTHSKVFKCTFCDYTCSDRATFRTHRATHVKPFKCTTCDKKFAQKVNLQRHIRTHTGEKPFSCMFCTYTSADHYNLKNHLEVHSDEKSFRCLDCDYTCFRQAELDRHWKTHTDEKPFRCDTCGHRCSQKGHLQRHVEKCSLLSCQYCDYKSTKKIQFRKHLQSHIELSQNAEEYFKNFKVETRYFKLECTPHPNIKEEDSN